MKENRKRVTIYPFEKLSNPPYSPFFKGGKGPIIQRISVNNLSSLCKREAGRDFWEGSFKPLNSYAKGKEGLEISFGGILVQGRENSSFRVQFRPRTW
jgi:hypothetical protein